MMRPSKQPRHLQLLEKFMIDWEKKVRAGTANPLRAGEREMAEIVCAWVSEKYTMTPITTYELEKRTKASLQENDHAVS
jgi:adenosylcobinamide amidohydrolase